MSPLGKGVVHGVLVTSVILLVALIVSRPDGLTLMFAIVFGVVVAVSTFLRERGR